jgi:hypothetical protein
MAFIGVVSLLKRSQGELIDGPLGIHGGEFKEFSQGIPPQ